MDENEDKKTLKNDDKDYGKREIKNYPSNSHNKREEQKEEIKKIEKVITGKVITRKRSLGKRMMESIVGDSVGVGGYILHDVLIPALKDTIADMVKGGIEMFLFPDRKGSRTSRDRGKSYVSYDSVSRSNRNRNDRDRDRDRDDRNRTNRQARHNFDDIILESRGEAEQVLSDLVDLTIDYDEASVSDLYEMVGIPTNYTDKKYGWTDLRQASISRGRDGYLLNLPKPIVLD